MKDIFKIKTNYCINTLKFSKGNVKKVKYGLQTMFYMGPKIWDFVLKELCTQRDEVSYYFELIKGQNQNL